MFQKVCFIALVSLTLTTMIYCILIDFQYYNSFEDLNLDEDKENMHPCADISHDDNGECYVAFEDEKVVKPAKKGFLRKLNLALSRIFSSKL